MAWDWHEIAKANREYHPCNNGMHVCGQTPDDERPLTLANVPGLPHKAWLSLKRDYALPDDDDFDLMIDWYVEGDMIDQFCIRRQSLDAVLKSAAPAA